ncbi:MAG: DUF916 domain-containing protein [Patulibacter minatonensis]
MDHLPRQRSVVRAASALLALALVLPSAASAAKQSTDTSQALPTGFGVRPVVPKGKDVPPSYFKIDAKPGSVARRSVVIINGTKKTKRLIIDGVDGLTGETTGVVYANRDDRHLEASRWLTPARTRIHVAPGEVRRMKFEVRIPADARPGDHVAGLAFEDAHTSTTKSRFAVKQVVRVVVGVQIHIDGGTPEQAALGKMSMKAQPGTHVATTVIQLSNTGDKLCHPKLKMVLQPQNGKSRTIERQLDTVLARDTINYPMPIEGVVDAGTYGATATVTDCGAAKTTTATVNLGETLNGTSPRADAARTVPAAAPSIPWVPLAIVMLLGIGGGIGGMLAVQRLRRRRDAADASQGSPPATPAAPTGAVAITASDVAEHPTA